MMENLPQLIYLALTLLGLGVAIAKHGEPQDNISFGRSLFMTIFILILLTWGGFFDGLYGL